MRRTRTIMANSNNSVAEMQGLYGPFTMAERVVQKIWLQRDFDPTAACLTDGRTLEVRSTGTWNLLGGPDFRSARVVIGGEIVIGDVEVHFHASDWRAHGHEADVSYDNVVLHVVLFPLRAGEKPALHRTGRAIPTLVLLPLLYRDLEEYTSDDALEIITARDEWRYFAELAARPLPDLQRLLTAKAQERWQQKVHFARVRIQKLGWTAALHHAALEILGYRHNRAAMVVVAGRYPLEQWADGLDAKQVYAENKTRWQLQGVRPANHPLVRLQQYHRWVSANPQWPDHVLRLGAELPHERWVDTPTRIAPRSLHLNQRRECLAHDLLRDTIGGTRLDNLVCDGLLPLLAAETENDYFALWFHWFVGDVPDQVRNTLNKLGLANGQSQPLCHGYARGLLSWFLECETHASG